jgi:hypothetical protein
METSRYEAIRKNILDAKVGIIPNEEADANALIDLLDVREQVAGRGVNGIEWAVVDGLRKGIRNAPRGVTVFHERLQLLQLFEAIDLLGEAVAPQPAPVVSTDPELDDAI